MSVMFALLELWEFCVDIARFSTRLVAIIRVSLLTVVEVTILTGFTLSC